MTYCYRRRSVVCLSVWWSRSWAKTAEPIEISLGVGNLGWAQGTMSRSSTGNGKFWGIVRPTEKHYESLTRFTQQKKSITASAQLWQPPILRQPAPMFQTGRCHNHIKLPRREKSAPPAMRTFHQTSFDDCYIMIYDRRIFNVC